MIDIPAMGDEEAKKFDVDELVSKIEDTRRPRIWKEELTCLVAYAKRLEIELAAWTSGDEQHADWIALEIDHGTIRVVAGGIWHLSDNVGKKSLETILAELRNVWFEKLQSVLKNRKCHDNMDTRAPFEKERDEAHEALHKISNWCKAYPLDVFPEPDFKEVAKVLKAAGITLDAVSASNMRHVTEGIQKIIDRSITPTDSEVKG